jgi:hypothetical protein
MCFSRVNLAKFSIIWETLSNYLYINFETKTWSLKSGPSVGFVLYFYEEPPVSVLKNKLELSKFRFHTETESRIGF